MASVPPPAHPHDQGTQRRHQADTTELGTDKQYQVVISQDQLNKLFLKWTELQTIAVHVWEI